MENIDTTNQIALALKHAGYVVYLNKTNPWGFPVFHVRGTNGSKPDLLVINPRYAEWVHGVQLQPPPFGILAAFAVETKTGDHLQDLPLGCEQLGTYLERFASGHVQYYTDRGIVRRIGAFLFATRHSLSGYLYKREPETAPLPWDFFTDTWHFLEYPLTKLLAAIIFHAKPKTAVLAAQRVTQEGRALASLPEMGVLKAGIYLDGRVTPHLWAFLPNRAVELKTITWLTAADELRRQQTPASHH